MMAEAPAPGVAAAPKGATQNWWRSLPSLVPAILQKLKGLPSPSSAEASLETLAPPQEAAACVLSLAPPGERVGDAGDVDSDQLLMTTTHPQRRLAGATNALLE